MTWWPHWHRGRKWVRVAAGGMSSCDGHVHVDVKSWIAVDRCSTCGRERVKLVTPLRGSWSTCRVCGKRTTAT